jgi:signal transduction histidine kinase
MLDDDRDHKDSWSLSADAAPLGGATVKEVDKPPRRPERRRPERRALFLAQISLSLNESLDYEQTLDRVARLGMPELGAWCVVDLLEADGSVRRLEIIHPDPKLQPIVRELEQRYPPRLGDSLGAPRLLKTQQPELVPEVSDEMLARESRDARHLEILRALRIGSYMVVPLKRRGRMLGTLTFVSADSGFPYTPRDLLFAEDLADRAAVAMDNARLYREAEISRKEAIDALAHAAESDRAKADFLSVMSHELHTPLNAIGGYAELLELGMRGPITEQQREAIARIKQSQQQLMTVVNDILTFSRSEHGRIPVKLETVNINDALDAVRFIAEPLIRANDLTYEFRGCAPPASAVADRERVQHIVVNLLSNAVKFSPRGSPIVIECLQTEKTVDVRVIDVGTGIPPEKHELIFQPFTQASTGFTRTAGGSGLGLAISRDLARLMGGDVTVASEPGRGSTFTLTLPAAVEAGAAL